MALSRLEAVVARPWFWAVVVGALFGAPLARGLTQGTAPAPPPVLGSFPAFMLPADDGREFKPGDLHGGPFIADLLCAHCARAAERAGIMRALQHRTRNLGDALRLMSFSQQLDLAALREVRQRQVAGQRWTLLSGTPPSAAELFAGDGVLLLVDGRLRIRGRYDGRRASEIDRLLRDAALVVAFP